ncbi:MAG: CsiV family protein [Methylococcales bacterium]|nr:CsiV family protein [Methylococcales bacterium]
MLKRHSLQCLLVAWWVLHIPLGLAQTRDLAVEALVFAQDTPTSEQFSLAATRIQWPEYWLDSSDFAPMLIAEQVLTSIKPRLDATGHYPWLGQWSFRQSIDAQQTGEAVRLVGIKSIDGFIQLKRGDYLEVEVDVEYQPDATQPRYRIQETRQLKFNQLHYFDHPKFGILLTIQP